MYGLTDLIDDLSNLLGEFPTVLSNKLLALLLGDGLGNHPAFILLDLAALGRVDWVLHHSQPQAGQI